MAINETAITDVLTRHMPGATVIFVTDPEGNRSVVAFEGPATQRIADYRRAAGRVGVAAALKKAGSWRSPRPPAAHRPRTSVTDSAQRMCPRRPGRCTRAPARH